MASKWIIQRRLDHPLKDGQIASEWLATMDRNQWPECIGICSYRFIGNYA